MNIISENIINTQYWSEDIQNDKFYQNQSLIEKTTSNQRDFVLFSQYFNAGKMMLTCLKLNMLIHIWTRYGTR